MGSNSFTFGNPIQDPAYFVGRDQEIRQIVSRLTSSAHESTSIIGERRIGKTSLLNHLTNSTVSEHYGLTSDKYCLVYMDFQGLTDITPQRFWQRVLTKISRNLCDQSLIPEIEKLSSQSNFDLFDLEDVFQLSSAKGLTIVLLLDEFEYVTQNPNFKSDFFGGLRALAIHQGLALVPATRRELVDLCHSEELKGSPFFNIFANVILKPFSSEETQALISKYSNMMNMAFSEQEAGIIELYGGRYPFFVQMAGYQLIETQQQGLSGDEFQNQFYNKFAQQADPHFNYMWSHSSESEKITLLMLLTLGQAKISIKTIPNLENLSNVRKRAGIDLQNLSKRGLVREENELFLVFSPAFANWIKQEMLATPGEDSDHTAEEWLKSGGQKEIVDAAGNLPKFKRKYWPILSEYIEEVTMKFAVGVSVEMLKGVF